MTTAELLGKHLKHDLEMLKWHLADFTDADMFHRPCPAGNHAMWQTGHIVSSTGRLLSMIEPSFKTPVSDEVAGKFTKESARIDDPAAFPTLQQLRDALDQLASAADKWIAGLPQSLLDARSPDWAKDWAATNGLLLAGIASHVQMHIGQVQMIRRCLGKPVLF